MSVNEAHLALANRHIVEAEQRIAAQTALIAQLAADGHDTTLATSLLHVFEQTLTLMRQDRQLILDAAQGKSG